MKRLKECGYKKDANGRQYGMKRIASDFLSSYTKVEAGYNHSI